MAGTVLSLGELLEESGIDMAAQAAPEIERPDIDKTVEISGLAVDSRQVGPGYLFAALPGSRMDGRDFIPDAIARGAAAILAPSGTRLERAPANDGRRQADIPLITDDNPRRALALLAARFYAPQPATIAAVTGTNGKTSVAAFTRQIWEQAGRSAASLGTLGLVPAVAEGIGSLTTPDPVALHRCLREVNAAGYDHLAIEASSHGLDQYRLDGLKVAAAAFTNLSRDHLDYHGTMEGYLAAKQRLFSELLVDGGTAVLNADAPEFAQLAEVCRARGIEVLDYGRQGRAIHLAGRRLHLHGQVLEIDCAGRRAEVHLPLVGDFQAENALAALGLALATGVEPDAALAALEQLQGAPGRLQNVARTPSGAQVFVDYAHTPEALRIVLEAVRPHTDGRLFVVFGAGGDRDTGKRPLMGEVASRLADVAIVTDDNPRSEDPAAIRAQIMAAAPGAQEIGDRRSAIETAVAQLRDGDLLVIAGKGHESGQIVGETVLPFDDAEVAGAAVGNLKGGQA